MRTDKRARNKKISKNTYQLQNKESHKGNLERENLEMRDVETLRVFKRMAIREV